MVSCEDYMTKLTPAAARGLQPGKTLRDHEVKGLELRARATKKTFCLYYRTRAGTERRPTIGTFPEMSLSSAREVAKDLKERIARGEDPSGDWKAAREAPTLSDLCDKYLKEYASKRLKPSTLKEYKHIIEKYIKPGLGRYRINEISKIQVDAFLEKVYLRKLIAPDIRKRRKMLDEDGKLVTLTTAETRACHVRRRLSTIFNVAIEYFELDIDKNPVHGTKVYREGKRKRHAEPHELPKIWAALKNLADTQPRRAACIMSLFLTGGRVSEILNARADQLRGKAGDHWVLALKTHKTDRHIGEKEIVLPPEVVEILKSLPAVRGKERVFGDVSIFVLQKTWRKVRIEAGCPDLKLLDTRRTFASFALSSGKSLDQIGELLGHTNPKTTKGYSFLIEELKQRSADEISTAIMEATKGKAA